MADVPLARRPPTSNGRPEADAEAFAAPDPAAARRARAAERSAPTVQFRSGSAAPVRSAGAEGDARVRRSPEPEGSAPREPAPSNGAANPASRRRRQLRAR